MFKIAAIQTCAALVLLPMCVSQVVADTPKIVGQLRVEPSSMTLTHHRHPRSLVVTGLTSEGQTVDFSSGLKLHSSDEKIARVNSQTWIEPVGNGEAQIQVEAAGQKATVKVVVSLPTQPQSYSFDHDVMPVLSKAGCNQGACHGYSLGKNGFKLSLRGADPPADYSSLTDEFFQRRINRHNSAASLLVTKPLGDVSHKGGVRLQRDSLMHKMLLGWIRDGAQADPANKVTFESLRIRPENVVLSPGWQQQLQVVATYSDGTERDVTPLSIFTVNTQRIASVTEDGLVSTEAVGETAVSARFERTFVTANFIVLRPDPAFKPTPVPEDNVIDRFVVSKLNALNVKPSELSDDTTFLRRIYLDLIGLPPTPEELQAFVDDKTASKRHQVIERLMRRPEFVDQWSLKWGDLLQNSRTRLSDPAVFAFREWIRSAVEKNLPLDEFARSILLSQGGATDSPTAAYYAVSQDTHETMQRATQVFCGVRMLCARCHPHPFENWTQEDYFGLYNFFNQVSTKNDPLLPGVKNAKSVLVNLSTTYIQNPRSRKIQPPRYLGGEEPSLDASVDRREPYVRWLTSSENPFFARSMTNRIWSYFFHRGIIEPVDDLRSTNPPINPELLDALATDLIKHGFDVRHLMRTIVTSRTYQRSSLANETNEHDDMNFSRFIPRRLSAETMLDSLVQATGVPESFPGAPGGFTAKQLPDANIRSDFLKLFGKPQRLEACECERDDGSNMLQALHFINGKSILSRVSAGNGRVAQLAKQHPENGPLVEQLYLWTLVRRPTATERDSALRFFQSNSAKRLEAAQDLMWALLNSRDFTMVH